MARIALPPMPPKARSTRRNVKRDLSAICLAAAAAIVALSQLGPQQSYAMLTDEVEATVNVTDVATTAQIQSGSWEWNVAGGWDNWFESEQSLPSQCPDHDAFLGSGLTDLVAAEAGLQVHPGNLVVGAAHVSVTDLELTGQNLQAGLSLNPDATGTVTGQDGVLLALTGQQLVCAYPKPMQTDVEVLVFLASDSAATAGATSTYSLDDLVATMKQVRS